MDDLQDHQFVAELVIKHADIKETIKEVIGVIQSHRLGRWLGHILVQVDAMNQEIVDFIIIDMEVHSIDGSGGRVPLLLFNLSNLVTKSSEEFVSIGLWEDDINFCNILIGREQINKLPPIVRVMARQLGRGRLVWRLRDGPSVLEHHP